MPLNLQSTQVGAAAEKVSILMINIFSGITGVKFDANTLMLSGLLTNFLSIQSVLKFQRGTSEFAMK